MFKAFDNYCCMVYAYLWYAGIIIGMKTFLYEYIQLFQIV